MTKSAANERSVTVVIPVRNEVANIEACINSILSQSVQTREIIVVDSRSTDGTIEVLKKFPQVRIISIDPESFNHGDARNIGVREADTEWVVLTVGDARAADNLWLENLFAGLIDENVVGVCGSQIVPRRPDTNPVEWFSPISQPCILRLQYSSSSQFDSLPPAQQQEACAWDDVSALYRRDVLLDLPFAPVMYGEDAIWAKAALRNGHALVYNTAARVHHYHNETADFTFRRTIHTLCFRYYNFGVVPGMPDVAGTMMRAIKRLVSESELTWRARIEWLRYNFRTQMAARSAFSAFKAALATGDTELEKLCGRYVHTPPVPRKADGPGRKTGIL